MLLSRIWTRSLTRRPQTFRHLPASRRGARLGHLEVLEDRTTPTVFVVSTATDEDNGAADADIARNDGAGLSLREAIRLANANGGGASQGEADGDAILFDSTVFAGGATIVLTLGELPVTDDVEIRNELADDADTNGVADTGGTGTAIDLTIDATTSASRIFNIDVAAAGTVHDVRLTNIDPVNFAYTLTGGDSTAATVNDGGAILNATDGAGAGIDATLVVTGVDFTLNTAHSGGAIATTATNATAATDTLTITGGSFTANTAAAAGGGIEVTVGRATLTNVQLGATVSGITVTGVGNTAAVNGGGLHITGAATVSVIGGTVVANTAGEEGGGLWNSATGTLLLTDNENGTPADDTDDTNLAIQFNVANGDAAPGAGGTAAQGGGGVFNNGGTLTITGTIGSANSGTNIQFNEARGPTNGSGGGLLSIGGAVTIDYTLIRANEAVRAGGGIEVVGGTMTITSSNIQSNDTSNSDNLLNTGVLLLANPGNGGGIHITAAATVTLDDVAIQDNVAEAEGGGIWNSATGTVVLLNSGTNAITSLFGVAGGVLIQNNEARGNLAAVVPTDLQGGGGVFNNGGTVTATGATIRTNTASGAAFGTGGGVLSVGGPVTLTNSTVADNTAAIAGGVGIVAGTVTVSGTAVTGNDAGGVPVSGTPIGNGGGLLILDGTVGITGGTISGNTATADAGGIGIAAGTVTITGTTIATNIAASDAGGIGINGGTLTLTSVTVSDNIATAGNAGGIGVEEFTPPVTVSITTSTISGNTAALAGGGLAVGPGAEATLTDSTTSGNTAATGGGAAVGAAGTITLTNSTVSGNTATADGGGIASQGGTVDLLFATIAGNTTVGAGGGLNLDATTTATATDTIIADNTAATGPDVAGNITANFSLIEDPTGATITGTSNITGVDPQLGPLQDNGGLTFTQQPAATSPVINKGDPAFVPPPATDQRGTGFPRVLDGVVDIGAVETAVVATQFVVVAPATAVAGTPFNFTVTAQDAAGNVATTYAGTVTFTSTDTGATLPPDSTLTSGTGTFPATLVTAGVQTITATDTLTPAVTGTSNDIAVSAAAATQFAVVAPATAVAGTPFNFTVTAQDAFGNTDTAYAGTVTFTSTDAGATLPPDATLTAGTGTFPATLVTAGTQTITATDTLTPAITGTSNDIAVSGAAATQFVVVAPATAVAGTPFNFTVTAQDAFGNTATGYTGTVTFTSTDATATLPADATLTSGTGTFSATLFTAGVQTITATDTLTPAVTGTSNDIAVSAAAATQFVIAAPGTATTGTPFDFTVVALDQFGNAATGYAGTVTFTSTDAGATLPADATLTNGTGTFSATLATAGTQTITATDTADATITGTSGPIAASAAPVPPIPPASTRNLVVGGATDGTARVYIPDASGVYPTSPNGVLAPFGNTGTNVRVAAGDVNGDTVEDTIVITGPGTAVRLAVISGADGSVLVAPFDPFGGGFTGGGFVTAADFDLDGRAEVIVTPDQGGGPRVVIFSLLPSGTFSPRASFFGIADPGFRGGARAGAGDVDGDGTPDLAVAAGFSGGPRVALYDGGTVLGATPTRLIGDFFVFDPILRNGVYVAIGDVNGDDFGDLIFGAGPGGAPRVLAVDGQQLLAQGAVASIATPLANFFVAGDNLDRGGVRVATKNADGDDRAEVVVGTGENQASRVRIYDGATFVGSGEPGVFQDLNPFGSAVLTDGVFVG